MTKVPFLLFCYFFEKIVSESCNITKDVRNFLFIIDFFFIFSNRKFYSCNGNLIRAYEYNPWQSFLFIAIKIIPLKTIDLWIIEIQCGFAKGIYSHLYYHTTYHSFSHLSNGIFYTVPILFNNIINNKNNISLY